MELSDIVLLLVFIALSGFFSGSETALVGMTRFRIVQALEEHDRQAHGLERWRDQPEKMLTSILIGNNIANIGAASLTAALATQFFPPDTAIWVNTIVMTTVILIFGEIVPKTLAKRASEPISLAVAGPLWGMTQVLAPFVWIFGRISHLAGRLVGASGDRAEPISRGAVRAVVETAGLEGALSPYERLLIEEVLAMRGTLLKEIMTPRISMQTIPQYATVAEGRRLASETGLSRLPVEGGSPDEIVGVLYAKDLLLAGSTENITPIIVSDVMRSPQFVPEVMTTDLLLNQFRQEKSHIAIVIGEHGDISGLVTLEDALEMLVGQITDEHDTREQDIHTLTSNLHVVSGATRLDDLSRQIGFEAPEGDYETIGGFLVSHLGSIPVRGAIIPWSEWSIRVLDASERNVIQVSLRFEPTEHRQPSQDES